MNEGIGKGLRVKPAMTALKRDCFVVPPRNDGIVSTFLLPIVRFERELF